MAPTIRLLEAGDRDLVVDFSLRAWAPVFASIEQALGARLFELQHPDWRADQARAVRTVLDSDDDHVWVAEVAGDPVGFVAVTLHHDDHIGEISMVVVHPEHQRCGIGTALTDFALERIRELGMSVAMIETGGDPGHASVRRTYEKAGFTLFPIARYFKDLT